MLRCNATQKLRGQEFTYTRASPANQGEAQDRSELRMVHSGRLPFCGFKSHQHDTQQW